MSTWWKERRIKREAIQRSKEIDKLWRSSAKGNERSRKVLLLGQSESGKSTFLKQMYFLYGRFSDEWRLSYREAVYWRTVEAMKILINALETPLSNPKNKEHKETILDIDKYNLDLESFHRLAPVLKSLWEDESIRETLQHTSKFELSGKDMVSSIAEDNSKICGFH